MTILNSTRRPANFIDITGQTFGQWYVVRFHSNDKQGAAIWLCRCSCGTEKPIWGNNLRRGLSTQCIRCARTLHGQARTPEYAAWVSMLDRCRNVNCRDYHNYGGRGISVCERWLTLENFFADMGPRPSSHHTLDRYPDNNGDYEPSNVRWATMKQQQRNRRNNRMLTHDGRTLCLTEWSQETGICLSTMQSRLAVGWSVEATLTTPPRKRTDTRRKPIITFRGETMGHADWARRIGVSTSTLRYRLQHGWSVEQALTTPGGYS